jgi:hypothetical protein
MDPEQTKARSEERQEERRRRVAGPCLVPGPFLVPGQDCYLHAIHNNFKEKEAKEAPGMKEAK